MKFCDKFSRGHHLIDVKVENKFTLGGEAMDNSSLRLKLAPFALAGHGAADFCSG